MAKKQNIKQKHCNSFCKDSKNVPHQKKKNLKYVQSQDTFHHFTVGGTKAKNGRVI